MTQAQKPIEEKAEDFEFDCPECGAHIVGEVTSCPKCHIEFVIEEVSELECPGCGATLSTDSRKCPKCGICFEDDDELARASTEHVVAEDSISQVEDAADGKGGDGSDLKKEFSRLVNDVKPLMILAKDFGIETTNCRRLVDKSVRAGKQRDIDLAVRTLKDCNDQLIMAITDRIDRDIEHLENLADVAMKMGSDPSQISKVIEEAKKKRAVGELEPALVEVRNGKRLAEQITGKYVEAHEMYEGLEKLVLNSERFYLDVREARKLLAESRDAGEHGDWTTMGILARKGREVLCRSLPDVIRNEIKTSKQTLLESKANGKDVSAMVKILKDAGVAIKREKYEEALERLIEFREEEKSI